MVSVASPASVVSSSAAAGEPDHELARGIFSLERPPWITRFRVCRERIEAVRHSLRPLELINGERTDKPLILPWRAHEMGLKAPAELPVNVIFFCNHLAPRRLEIAAELCGELYTAASGKRQAADLRPVKK